MLGEGKKSGTQEELVINIIKVELRIGPRLANPSTNVANPQTRLTSLDVGRNIQPPFCSYQTSFYDIVDKEKQMLQG